MASGTPDMKRLKEILGIDSKSAVDSFARAVMYHEEELKEALVALSSSFFENETPAHKALAEIQEATGVKVATENLDTLGDSAGINEIKRHQIDLVLTDEELAKIDFIITAGLSADDSGLLYRYKEINPNGKIIALNIEPPHYLEDSDYYVEGDIQVTLPKIRELL
jgi:NAD-dependent SIR2 family protein deacetylase